MPSQAVGLQTRDRILEAAHRIFAQKGFRAATVFDIVSEAGANQASINYHFGGKEKLYHEVLRYSFRRMVDLDNSSPDAIKGAPEEKLRSLIRSMLGAMSLDDGWYRDNHRLLMWETLMPSGAFDELLDKEMVPHLKMVTQVVREFLGANMPNEPVVLAAMWLVGACGYFAHARPMVSAHFPDGSLQKPEAQEKLADFLTSLSLNGLLTASPSAWREVPAA